jgi:hypothetical protein
MRKGIKRIKEKNKYRGKTPSDAPVGTFCPEAAGSKRPCWRWRKTG